LSSDRIEPTDDQPLTESELQAQLERVQLDETQQIIFNDIAESLAQSLDFPLLSVKGFYLYALRDWQQQISMTVEETEDKLATTPEVRKIQQVEILECFRERATKVLERREKLDLLDDAIKKAVELYATKYASR
jgi:hypothetical protein